MENEVQGLGGGLKSRRIKCSKYLSFGQHILRLRHINGAKLEQHVQNWCTCSA